MEVEEIQAQACKFPRIGNGRLSDSSKIGHKGGEAQYPDDDDDGDLRRLGSGNIADAAGENRLRGWHHSSRIIRVSRASGGKDRHSKVWTSKGLRDRRVRLSVTTAIQFYDLQDRLGYDQPSKAVEWLIKAAADAISELPSLNSSFPDTPKQLSDEKREGFDSAEMELDGDHNFHQNHNQNNQLSASKSSSTSETSKGSGLSLSRSEVRVNRVKASRERAKERAAKEKEQQNVNPISQNSSFTELLTGGGGAGGGNSASSPTGSAQHNHGGGEASLYHKAASRQWGAAAAAPMDYFSSSGLLGGGGGGSSSTRPIQAFHLGNSYNVAGDGHHPEQLQQFSFVPDHFIPVVSSPGGGGGGDYNLNFTISSSSSSGGLAGYNRGTLQSNSPSFMLPHHLQRFASPIDGSSNVPFFIGTATPVDHHHHHHHQHLQQQQQQQHQNQFPAGLQLCYGDGSSSSRHHSDHKEKGKNS